MIFAGKWWLHWAEGKVMQEEGEARIALGIHFIDTIPNSDSTLGSASLLIPLKQNK